MKRQALAIAISLLLVVPLFHNCGEMQSKTESLSSLACEIEMQPVFEKTYHKFFTKQTCTRCHSPNTIAGTPKFADPNTFNALQVFMPMGPDKIESKLKSGHQGYAYGNVETELLAHKKTWEEALLNGSCTGSDFISSGRTIDFFEPMVGAPDFNLVKPAMRGVWVTLTWNLDDGRIPDTKGVEFSMDVQVIFNPTLFTPQHYLVNNVKMKTTNHDLDIKGIYILLNGKTHSVSTFTRIETTLSKSSEFQVLKPDSAAAMFDKDDTGENPDKYENADRWNVRIEYIKKH